MRKENVNTLCLFAPASVSAHVPPTITFQGCEEITRATVVHLYSTRSVYQSLSKVTSRPSFEHLLSITSFASRACDVPVQIFAAAFLPPHERDSLRSLVVVRWEKWAGADYELRPDVLASLRASGLLRICLDPFPRTADRSLSLTVLRCGKSGPAQIRTAVTATRRPKDTRLPHRPAWGMYASDRLTVPLNSIACERLFRTARSPPCPDSGGRSSPPGRRATARAPAEPADRLASPGQLLPRR